MTPFNQTSNVVLKDFSPLLLADVIETPTDFHIMVDLPGVLPEDVDVNICNGFINLKAERKQIHDETFGFTHNIERCYGRVTRTLRIPTRADQSRYTATFKHGVLNVSFSKTDSGIPMKKLTIM